jgi:hypothetical protein
LKELNYEKFNNYLYNKIKVVLFYKKSVPIQIDNETSPQNSRVLKHSRNKSLDVKLSIDTKDKGARNSNNYLDMSSILTPSSQKNGNSSHIKNSILMHSGHSGNYSDSNSIRVIDKFYKNQVRL